ncbi:MAG: ABC transporter substrate-binding protein, partial [Acidimicrobiales bacterium]
MNPTVNRTRRALAAGALAVALLAGVSACGSSSSSSSPGGSKSSGGASTSASGTLDVVAAPSGPFVRNFNPFSTSNVAYLEGVTSFIYEPLMQYNLLKAGQIYPWLATSWTWSDGGRTLTLQLRSGVKWSDGQPFTASDVAYTFELLMKHAGLNTVGVSNLVGARASSPSTAVLQFSQPSYGQLFQISQVLIVPEHLWSKVANPVTYADANPVGTGPYELQSFSAQVFTLTRNPSFWQPGEPKIATIRTTDYVSNTSADLALEQGQIDWAALFIPHYQTLFVNKAPATNHVWLPAVGNIYMCPNDAK